MLWDAIRTANLPVFPINPSHVHIIKSPPEFYNTLLDHIRSAKKRIVLSTLYIGTDDLETELVESIEKTVRERNVQVLILLDASRGLRCSSITHQFAGSHKWEENRPSLARPASSCTLLAPLTSLQNVRVVLYHNPHLRGLINYILPARLNEALGVQHIKAYVVDDSVIISGANLSDEYFNHRQDRAWLFENTVQLANFYHGLVNVLARFCYELKPNGRLETHSPKSDPIKAPLAAFKHKVHVAVLDYIESIRKSYEPPKKPEQDTYAVPLLQLGVFNLRMEENFTTRLFSSLAATNSAASHVSMASGYFNLTSSYAQLLVNYAKAPTSRGLDFLCASPKANGFLNSGGVSGYIPMAYRESLIRLLYRFQFRANQNEAIHGTKPTFFEFERPNWTFHAKGLWVREFQKSSDLQCPSSVLATIGSSNFSYRSLNRDVESQLIIWTRNEMFVKRIEDEQNFIFNPSYRCAITMRTLLAESHFRLPWFLRFAYPLFHSFM